MAVYLATKVYVLSFSEAIAKQLAGTGAVTVTSLRPVATATNFAEASRPLVQASRPSRLACPNLALTANKAVKQAVGTIAFIPAG